VGIDRAAGMLAAVGELPSGWTTTLADARAVPLPAGWADVVTCAYVLHLLMAQQRVDVLAEARRLLRPSPWSRLVVVTVWADRRGPAGRLRYGALRRLARLRPEPLGGLQPLDPAAELEAAGFEVTRRVVLTRHGYPSLVLAGRPAFRTGTADVVA
jgi:hypothetical protein